MFSRIKSKISSISSSRSPSPSPSTNDNNDLQLGLKTLLIIHATQSQLGQPEPQPHDLQTPAIANNNHHYPLHEQQKILHSHNRVLMNHSLVDDIIMGTDSGVHILSSHSNYDEEETMMMNRNTKKKENENENENKNYNSRVKKKKEHPCYPPPISMAPMVAGTRNLGSTGAIIMPWVLTRHNEDGRLILKGHRVQHHRYLECHRHNGRLIVNLITINDDNLEENHVDDDDFKELEVEEKEEVVVEPVKKEEVDHDDELNTSIIHSGVWPSMSDGLSYLENELSINRGMLIANSMNNLGCSNSTNIIIHQSHHHLYSSHESPGSSSSLLCPMTTVIN
ncbi:uncharacterized protein LOC133032617 [Cannabis sativa]|uniref:uncharacterized protein LOC133032617 n=1 Tax=Cannabis sativa TaxID=3483 RepID=UPI0029CAAB5F|nr:uncharacterized protein LOC133032617 [Cannabis sativa]XP_060962626.1 uncharacterized protein LOC133032617 [Cannabis sativa]